MKCKIRHLLTILNSHYSFSCNNLLCKELEKSEKYRTAFLGNELTQYLINHYGFLAFIEIQYFLDCKKSFFQFPEICLRQALI